MPLTQFQLEILKVIRDNRSPESHFAGGIVLNQQPNSVRYSNDFDIFHAAEDAVVTASELDMASLRTAGYLVEPTSPWNGPSTFRRASVKLGEDRIEIDWAADSSVRFFPIERDEVLGWRLHLFDAATNKALALASRSVTRDLVDIVAVDPVFPLEAVVWAACGKDAGFQPMMLLNMMRRFARINPGSLQLLSAMAIDPVELKTQWLQMAERAESDIKRIANERPDLPIGVAFLDSENHPGWIGHGDNPKIHHPTVGGCWPRFAESE